MTVAVKTTTAVGYFRVSAPGQAGERHVSLEAQTTQFNDYCRVRRLDPVATFTDVASGRKDDRKEYRRMLEHVAQEGIGNVVVLFLDRFGRPCFLLLRKLPVRSSGTTNPFGYMPVPIHSHSGDHIRSTTVRGILMRPCSRSCFASDMTISLTIGMQESFLEC